MRPRLVQTLPACLFLSGLLLAGCDQTEIGDGLPSEVDCGSCHGDSDSPAPPGDLDGQRDTGALGVGAHRAHLTDGTISQAAECGHCHVPVLSVDQPGHVDALPAEVTFSGLAWPPGLVPRWDRTAASCSNTYCHGATLTGGLHTAPVWTTVDGSQRTCASCHGAPPPPPHPAVGTCADCHPQTVQADGRIDLAAGKHLDGELDVAVVGCASCHGSEHDPAPPTDLDGGSDPSRLGVGAHQAHLRAGVLRHAVACQECHRVPANLGDEGHMDDDLPAELTWGALATADGAIPVWGRAGATCSGTYCHGGTLDAGGSLTAPVWTTVDGSQATCGTCHGNPPPAPHPQSGACQTCHPTTVTADGLIDVASGDHIDGEVDRIAFTCSSCHGSDQNPAPPVSTTGQNDPSLVGIGAHQAHLVDGAIRQAITCDQCHLVPADPDDPTHADGLPAELAWGALASADGATPVWDRDGETCQSTYCHGATLDAGGLHTAPVWTQVDGTQATCGGCHGAPPPAPHPGMADCSLCHPRTVTAGTTIDVAGGFHIDGQIQTGP